MKISRELQLLRAQLTNLLGGGGPTVTALEFIEFEQDDGDKIRINPADVSSLEERQGKTRIHMKNGDSHTVIELIAVVVAALED